MRLAFIKKKFSIHGGAERYLQTLIRHLKKAGHEIHIVANQWTDEEGITFHKTSILPLGSFLSTLTFNINARFTVHSLRFYDCVISLERTTCQDIYRAGEGCHAEWLKIRSMIEPFYKNLSFKINPLHLALLNLEKELFRNTSLIIANSRMVKEQIMKHYAIPDERITIIYNGVDLKKFTLENKTRWRNAVRKTLNIPEDSNILLFVGSGFERKGLRILIDAVSLLKKDYRGNIKLLIIGKGDIRKYKTRIETHGIEEDIIFLGPQKDVEKFYAAADLFVLPTLYDPFSNATLEAMASGIPVITTKNNGVAELIEKGGGGLIMDSLFDACELSDKISFSFNHLTAIGEEARKAAEQFPIEMAVNEFENIINRFQNQKELHAVG